MQQTATVRIVNATEAKNRFGEMIKHAYQDSEHLIVQRSGIPVVAILPMDEYERLMVQEGKSQSDQAHSALTPLTGLSKTELLALAQAVVAPDRQQKLNDALATNRETDLSDEARTSLDVLLDQLLNEVDQIALLKARALYTLKLQQTGV